MPTPLMVLHDAVRYTQNALYLTVAVSLFRKSLPERREADLPDEDRGDDLQRRGWLKIFSFRSNTRSRGICLRLYVDRENATRRFGRSY